MAGIEATVERVGVNNLRVAALLGWRAHPGWKTEGTYYGGVDRPDWVDPNVNLEPVWAWVRNESRFRVFSPRVPGEMITEIPEQVVTTIDDALDTNWYDFTVKACGR